MNRNDGPTSPLPAFASGAIEPLRHAFLIGQLKKLAGDYPVSVHHRLIVNQLGGEFVFAAPLRGRFQGRWLVLIRFGRVIEERFGFSSEVIAIYDHHNDLQVRTVDSIPEAAHEALPEDRRSVAFDVSFVYAPDPRAAEKLKRWCSPERLLLPLPLTSEQTAQDFLAVISRTVYSRDLYQKRGVVTGRDFFGRQRLVSAVIDDVDNHRVPGIFGMRKTGKTSLLQELIRVSRDSDLRTGRSRVFVYQDLEHLSGFDGGDPVVELIQDLSESIRRGFKDAGMRTREVSELAAGSGPTEFRAAIDGLLERVPSAELVVLLDEVEYLCPPNAERTIATATTAKVPQLFGAFRKLVQERDNFGLVLSGLASATVEASELYGRPNPLFSFANTYYLGSFSDEDGADLLRGVGGQVGLNWDDSAVRRAMAESGGSPMLLRDLGSSVLNSIDRDRTEIVKVDDRCVVNQLDQWRRRVASNLREVVLHLQRFYPEEAALIGELMHSTDEFGELAYLYPDHVHRLEQLGVIEQVDGKWIPSRVLQMGWELASRTDLSVDANLSPRAQTRDADVADRSLAELLALEECQWLEFKETATFNAHTGSKDESLRDVIVAAVSGMLNSEGGTLVIGVHDDRTVVGLDRDYSVTSSRKDRDGFENWLYTILTNGLGKPIVSSDVVVSFESLEDREVCRIRIRMSPKPVFVGGDELFYVRMGNSTRSMNVREANEYIGRHWS